MPLVESRRPPRGRPPRGRHGAVMTEITIRHVISLCPRTQALIEQLAASLRSVAQPLLSVSPSAPQTEVPGESGPVTSADPQPQAEGPGRAAGGTAGEAPPSPRPFSDEFTQAVAVAPAPKQKRQLSPEHLEKLRQQCAVMCADKLAQAAGGPVPVTLRTWNPERDAVLRRDYPAGIAIDVIHAAVMALPGKPVARDRIAIQAAKIGLKRPAKLTPPAAVESQPAPPPVAAHNEMIATAMWTPERDAIVREDYPTRTPMRDMLTDLNMLPGTPVERQHVHTRAGEMRLVRPFFDPASQAA